MEENDSVNHQPLVTTFTMTVLFRDMVKRLINKMDFGALEVKMKKCKVSYCTDH